MEVDKDTRIAELQKEVGIERDRADRLLARNNEMELQRKMLADFLWPVYEDYLIGEPMNIQIKQKRANISISRVREPIKFDEDSIEGAIIKLARANKFNASITARSIKKKLEEIGYVFDVSTVKEALEKLTMSPFHVLDKTKDSNGSWKYSLNKEEAKEAFKN